LHQLHPTAPELEMALCFEGYFTVIYRGDKGKNPQNVFLVCWLDRVLSTYKH
jgi:hypothetical protein